MRKERLGVLCLCSCVRQERTHQHDCLLDAEAVQLQQVVSHGTATRGRAEDEVEVVGGGMWHRFMATFMQFTGT